MNNLGNLITALENEAVLEDFTQVVQDPQTRTTLTYHSTGTETRDRETGAINESGGVDVEDIYGYRGAPIEKELKDLKVGERREVYIIMAADLSAVTPKLNDRIVVGSVTKYIMAFTDPTPGHHFRFLTTDIGNNG